MEVGQHLLAVGVADRDGADAGADHTQGRLVQVGRQHVLGLAAGQGPEQPEGDRVVPAVGLARSARSRNGVSSVAHQAQVAPSASNCSPISRLAVRIEGGMIETSARRFSAARSAGRPARAAAAAGGDEHALERPERRPKPSQGPALEALGVVDQAAGDRRFQAPRMGVAADRQGRVGDLEQAEVQRVSQPPLQNRK